MAIHTGQLNGIALCAGNGGLELGLKLALGKRYKTVCYVEREAYNAATLVARMEDKTLDNAPIWDNVTTFDGKAWRGLVDIISAGFPCQPHSSAGHRKGIADERWLWDSIERIFGEILPGIVWLENVPDLAFSGLNKVIGSLSKAGYSSVWDTFSAKETGASQKRERLFILSYRHGLFDGREQTQRETRRNALSGSCRQNFPELVCAGGDGFQTRCVREGIREFEPAEFIVANGLGGRRASGRQVGLSRRLSIVPTSDFVFPPFRDDYEGWAKYLAERPELEPAVLRSSDGTSNRVDRLRTTGNGVVPLVAAYAFASLARTAFKVSE